MRCKESITLVLLVLIFGRAIGQEISLSVVPDADAFVSSQAPTSNYGGGGALTVSGSAAVNGSGQQSGLYDTLMRFPMSNVVASLDSAFGAEDWVLSGARLVLTEIATPDNAIFNRGVGVFEIQWIAQDGWSEGTGKPMSPTTDGVTWADLPSILNSNLDVSLGIFTNNAADGPIPFNLALPERLVSDVHSGGDVGLHLTARSPEIGFTFNSRSFGNTNARPIMSLTARANPKPAIDSIQVLGANVNLAFQVLSNWNYTLQCADSPVAQSAYWSNLLTLPAQSATINYLYSEPGTNRQRYYRLQVAP